MQRPIRLSSFDTCMHFDNIQDNFHFGALNFVNGFVPCVLLWLLLSNELFLFDTNILKQSIPQSSMADGISCPTLQLRQLLQLC